MKGAGEDHSTVILLFCAFCTKLIWLENKNTQIYYTQVHLWNKSLTSRIQTKTNKRICSKLVNCENYHFYCISMILCVTDQEIKTQYSKHSNKTTQKVAGKNKQHKTPKENGNCMLYCGK